VKWAAIIAAAGSGTRFGQPKQLIEIAGLPMIAWSMRTFQGMPEICALIIATEPEHVEAVSQAARRFAPRIAAAVTFGGAVRRESVRAALELVPAHCEGVFVHDGARPLVRAADVREGMCAVSSGVAAFLAAPVVDTIKVADAAGKVTRTLDRQTLWAAQTPQFALTADMRRAHERARDEGWEATDDAVLLERIGLDVLAIPASAENFKVTHPFDRDRAESILQARLARMEGT
jgi:2-C-methyl-D-erythritol 4-phosphate cytidylyltransferase